jgi:hypothetical protein
MKSTVLARITGTALLAVLALPAQIIAQEEHEHKREHFPHYRVIDLGTLGGTYSFAFGINNAGDQSQLFLPFADNYFSFFKASIVVAGRWECEKTRERFPRAVGSGFCFPSGRHFHGLRWLFRLLLWPSWPVQLDSLGCLVRG